MAWCHGDSGWHRPFRKVFAGDDTLGKVGDRFRDFVDHYFATTSTPDREVIYQLRNALLHSFGLYSQAKGKIYRFFLTANGYGPLVTTSLPDNYYVDLRVLHREFENAVAQYKLNVDKDASLQAKFTKMFVNYGGVYIA